MEENQRPGRITRKKRRRNGDSVTECWREKAGSIVQFFLFLRSIGENLHANVLSQASGSALIGILAQSLPQACKFAVFPLTHFFMYLHK